MSRPFFTPEGLEVFRKRITEKPIAVADNLRDLADKELIRAHIIFPSNEWARLVVKALPDYEVIEDRRVQGGFGQLKQYSWVRLYLREFGDKGIYFRLGVGGKGSKLTYNIDYRWGAKNPLLDEEAQRVDSALKDSGIQDQSVYPKDFSHYDWTRLVDETVSFIKQYEPLYRRLHTLLNAYMEATKKAKEGAEAAFAAKFPNPNIILYGPPGTGKTHHTLDLAYELLTGEPPASYADAQQLFQQELGKRVEFVTFHQSFGYEDFVQGIKPEVNKDEQLVFKPKHGVFYEIARRARDEFNQQDLPDRPGRVPFDIVFQLLTEPLQEPDGLISIPMKRGGSLPLLAVDDDYLTIRRGEGGETNNLLISNLRGLYEKTLTYRPGGIQIYYQYVVSRLEELAADIKREGPGAHPQAHLLPWADRREAGTDEMAPPRNYVLIIDEINRANISKVFGELITLLEKDKRLGGKNPLAVTLPSGEAKFNVPANLYLIGTMNTADKSIALLDIALRRRFEFKALYPIYKMDDQRFEHADVFEKLNKEIVRMKSRDFQIGHAYFMNEAGKAAEPLADILNKKVIPLLYEYFLNDDKKVKEALEKAGIPVHEDADTGLLRHGAVA